jgi:hypothetical protein
MSHENLSPSPEQFAPAAAELENSRMQRFVSWYLRHNRVTAPVMYLLDQSEAPTPEVSQSTQPLL